MLRNSCHVYPALSNQQVCDQKYLMYHAKRTIAGVRPQKICISHISGAVLQQKQENRRTVGWNEKQKMAMKRETGQVTKAHWSRALKEMRLEGLGETKLTVSLGLVEWRLLRLIFFVCLCFDTMFIFLNILIKHRAIIARWYLVQTLSRNEITKGIKCVHVATCLLGAY